jgi:hypothetical protein
VRRRWEIDRDGSRLLLFREPGTAQDGGALGFARGFSDGAKGGAGRREARLFAYPGKKKA